MMMSRARGYWKAHAQRAWLHDELAAGGRVHVAAMDGLWCVTATGIGPLWRKIWQPCPDRRRQPASGTFYRQIQRERTPWPGTGHPWGEARWEVDVPGDRSTLEGEWTP